LGRGCDSCFAVVKVRCLKRFQVHHFAEVAAEGVCGHSENAIPGAVVVMLIVLYVAVMNSPGHTSRWLEEPEVWPEWVEEVRVGQPAFEVVQAP
jgi:hypothetical protein